MEIFLTTLVALILTVGVFASIIVVERKNYNKQVKELAKLTQDLAELKAKERNHFGGF